MGWASARRVRRRAPTIAPVSRRCSAFLLARAPGRPTRAPSPTQTTKISVKIEPGLGKPGIYDARRVPRDLWLAEASTTDALYSGWHLDDVERHKRESPEGPELVFRVPPVNEGDNTDMKRHKRLYASSSPAAPTSPRPPALRAPSDRADPPHPPAPPSRPPAARSGRSSKSTASHSPRLTKSPAV